MRSIPRLEAEGLITTVPQRGMQVAHVDLSLVRNAFQFRLFLETQAVPRSSRQRRQRPGRGQTPAHARGDHPPAERGDDDDADRRGAEATDLELHETIIDALDNDIVAEAFRVNWIKIKLIRHERDPALFRSRDPGDAAITSR